jgi:hypothetical protein
MTNSKLDLLNLLVLESDNYSNLHDLEKLAETPAVLKSMPIQPLYLAVKRAGADQVALILPHLAKEQKEALLDLDLWHRDAMDTISFAFWPKAYVMCKDLEVIGDFASSDQFLLYLKSVCHLYTFDAEDPQYPDHDDYFLTDDTLVLIEYGEEYDLGKELRYLIKNLYGKLGPTDAYKLLFKIISEPHMLFTEELYQEKKSRLRDFGFVDYYDALELKANFSDLGAINYFIKTKECATGALDDDQKNQKLHSSSIISFKTGMESIHNELSKLQDQKRTDFLQFNFVRLVNATMALENSLKSGAIAMNRVGKVSKQLIELGFSYIASSEFAATEESLFERFDFMDLFRVGSSLIYLEQKKLKKSTEKSGFDLDNDYFCGAFWNHYLDCSFDENVKLVNFEDSKGLIINNSKLYWSWSAYNDLFISVLPLIGNFYQGLQNLIEAGSINDSFYMNYNLAEIDFEAIMLSSFINFTLDSYKDDTQKMGLTIEEFSTFVEEYFIFDISEHKIKLFEDFSDKIKSFSNIYSLEKIAYFDIYLYQLIRDNLEGYNFNNIDQDDFKHIGGPILLSLA